jgi:hypothetical protein
LCLPTPQKPRVYSETPDQTLAVSDSDFVT